MPLSVFGLMNVVGQALSVQQARMEAVSSNLANAQTTRALGGGPYRRRDVVLAEAPPGDGFGALVEGSAARGVRVAAVREDATPPRRVYDPAHPDADPEGYVEYPNVNSVEEMVNLITVMRSYQANLASFQALHEMAQKSLGLGK